MKALVIVAVLATAARAEPPYLRTYGKLDANQRIALQHRLAGEARAAGDRDGEVRYTALECWSIAGMAGDPDLRGPVCDRARAGIAERKLVDGEVLLLMVEGSFAAWRLDVPRAIDRLSRAIAVGKAIDLKTPEATLVLRAHFALGALMLEGGYYDQALGEIGFAAEHARGVGSLELVAWTDLWMCRAHTLLGDRERATEHCNRVETYLARDPDLFIEMNLRWMQAELDYAGGKFTEALRRYREGYALSQAPGGQIIRATFETDIATSLIALGQVDEATPLLDKLDRDAAAGAIPATYVPQVAEQRGEAAFRRGDLVLAQREFQRAAASQMHWVSIRALGRLAYVAAGRGDVAAARAAHEEAIRRIESERLAVDGALQRALFMAIHAAPYRELAVMSIGEPERALELAEAGRARALLDALATAHVPSAAAKPPRASEIRGWLAPGEVFVEYVAGERSLIALVVTADRVVPVTLAAAGTAQALAARVGMVRQIVASADTEAALGAPAAAAYADLIAPALAAAPGATTLIVSPDGALHDLPFEALVPAELVVARVPSGAVLAPQPRSPPASVRPGESRPASVRPGESRPIGAVLIAQPPDTAGLGELPGARDESLRIRALLAGEVMVLAGGDATIERVRDQLARFAVLHFAGHAVLDPVMPLRSALVLAPSAGDDGRWRAADIYTRANVAELVVLSACSTARGAPAGGEGVTSLARAFMYAGARATLSTLWNVDDRGGAAFIAVLYPRLADGETVGAAVAHARAELRGDQPPRVWAAYVLSGAPGRRVSIAAVPVERRSRSIWPVVAGAALGLVVAVLLRRAGRRL
ncbi:MAG: CHAT domain-containing protein [Kofleriaceae bacterium]